MPKEKHHKQSTCLFPKEDKSTKGSSPQFFVSAPPDHIKKEREKGRKLKKTSWWQNKLNQGKCYYCGKVFKQSELSMEHLVPLARGGFSIKNNIVPACKKCNFAKKQKTILEWRLHNHSD